MAILVTTPKSASANSYASVSDADTYIRQRKLRTTVWTSSVKLPDADGYVSDAKSAGALSCTPSSGSGTITSGCVFKFSGHSTEYTASAAYSGSGNLTFTPALTASVSAGEAIQRITASSAEKALMQATMYLDSVMLWYGTVRTLEQALRMPRYGLLKQDGSYYDYDSYPTILVYATIEFAYSLLQTDRLKTPAAIGLGVSYAKIGPLTVAVDKTKRLEIVPEHVLDLLSPLGRLSPSAARGSAGTVSLMRS